MIVFFLILLPFLSKAQRITQPDEIYASYFGEAITHPGLKLGVAYYLWQQPKEWSSKKGKEKFRMVLWRAGFSAGFWYHHRYQTGIFILPETDIIRKGKGGGYYGTGLALGYLRTQIPNVYEVDQNGDVNQVTAGYDQLLTGFQILYGKDYRKSKDIPFGWEIKPQVMVAVPNFENSTGYFFLELSARYYL